MLVTALAFVIFWSQAMVIRSGRAPHSRRSDLPGTGQPNIALARVIGCAMMKRTISPRPDIARSKARGPTTPSGDSMAGAA